MDVKQIATMVNTISAEVLGESVTVNEDLSNIVDAGTAVFDANAVEPFSKALVNQIGKMVFVNRKYAGGVPSVLMDGWEWGSIMAKVSADMPDVTVNESWELNDGSSPWTKNSMRRISRKRGGRPSPPTIPTPSWFRICCSRSAGSRRTTP